MSGVSGFGASISSADILSVQPVGRGPRFVRQMQIIDETLDADPTAVNSIWLQTQGCERVRVIMKVVTHANDEGKTPSLNVACVDAEAADDTNDQPLYFLDGAGGADTPQASETIAASGAAAGTETHYYEFNLDPANIPNWMRLVLTGTDTDATNTIAIDAWIQLTS